MIRIAVIAACVALAGCQTKTVEEMNYSERKALAAEITKRCYDQGVKPNSAEYNQCSQVEVQREVATRNRRAVIEDAHASAPRFRANCQNFGGNVVCF